MLLFFLFITTDLSQCLGPDATANGIALQQYYAGTPDSDTILDGEFDVHITAPFQIMPTTPGTLRGNAILHFTFEPGVNWKEWKAAIFIASPGFKLKGLTILGPYDYLDDNTMGVVAYNGSLPTGWTSGEISLENCTIKGFRFGFFGRIDQAPGPNKLSLVGNHIEAHVGAALYHANTTDAHELFAAGNEFMIVPIVDGHGDGMYLHCGISAYFGYNSGGVIPLYGYTKAKHFFQQYGSVRNPAKYMVLEGNWIDGRSSTPNYFNGHSAVMFYPVDEPTQGCLISGNTFLGEGCNIAIRLRHGATITNNVFDGVKSALQGYNVPNTDPGVFVVNDNFMRCTNNNFASVSGGLKTWIFSNNEIDMSQFSNPNAIFRTDGPVYVQNICLINNAIYGSQVGCAIWQGNGFCQVFGGANRMDYLGPYNKYGFNSLDGSGGAFYLAPQGTQTGGLAVVDPNAPWIGEHSINIQ